MTELSTFFFQESSINNLPYILGISRNKLHKFPIAYYCERKKIIYNNHDENEMIRNQNSAANQSSNKRNID